MKVLKFDSVDAYGRGRTKSVLPLFFQTALLFLFVVLIQYGCATPAEIKREASLPVEPEWIKKPPHSEDTLYFIGISTSAETLEEGQKAALKSAMSEISNYMGTRIESVFKSYLTEIEQNLSLQMKSESAAFVKGAKVVDSYYEKIIRIDKNFRMEKYDVYLLVSFSMKEVKKELMRQQKEKLEKVNMAYKYYLTGLSDEKKRKFYNARRAFNQAIALIAQIKDVIEIEGKDVKNSEELNFHLNSHLQYITSQLLRVSLSIKVSGSEKSEKVFISNFRFSLGKCGFTITNEESAFEISGDVSVSGSSYLMNNYVYYAEGSVSAERTSDHQVVATYSFKTKGFHRQKKQAALNALAEAGIESGNALSGLVWEKEKLGKVPVSHEGN